MSSSNRSNSSHPATSNRPDNDSPPGIYRKPMHDREDLDATVESRNPGIYSQRGIIKGLQSELVQLQEDYKTQIQELRERESLLAEMKGKYDAQIVEYDEKQKRISVLNDEFAKQEELLRRKCSVLKTAVRKAEEAVPSAEEGVFKGRQAAFEREKARFEMQLEGFNSSRMEYEQQLAVLMDNKEELLELRAGYEEEMQTYLDRKKELDWRMGALENMFSSGDGFSVDIGGLNCDAAMDHIKSKYISELKDINRKRADLATLREEIGSEETMLRLKSSGIAQIREHTEIEFSRLLALNAELDATMRDYESNLLIIKEERPGEELEDLRELNSRLEQQSAYIRCLEGSLAQMQKALDDTMSEVMERETGPDK